MQRLASPPRPDWENRVEAQGFHFHSIAREPYWDESAYYQFSRAEIDLVEKATYALNDMCLQAVQHVIDEGLWKRFGIPAHWVDFFRHSWETDEITIYGRFDFSYDGVEPPKLLEYNADTPTALLE